MPSEHDILKATPDAVGAKAEPPPPQGERATPPRWALDLGVWPYKAAMRRAGYAPDAEITEKQFRDAVAAHNERVVGLDGRDVRPSGKKVK